MRIQPVLPCFSAILVSMMVCMPVSGWAMAEYLLPDAPITITQPTVTTVQPPKTDMLSLMKISRDPGLLRALQLLGNSPYADSLRRLQVQNAHVIYKDLRTISKAVKDYDALSWISPRGEWVIFVNHHHHGAPVEALAALLAHETLHDDPQNCLQEEISGWTREAEAWRWFVERNTELALAQAQWPLVQRLETLREAHHAHTLEALVRNNPGYKSLPETIEMPMKAATTRLNP